MKEVIKIKLLLIGLALVLLSASSLGQQGFDTNMWKSHKEIKQLDRKTIKLDLSITIDNQTIEDTTYTLSMYNTHTKVTHTLKVSNKFVIYLDYNSEFEISISYNNTNIKTIYIDTEAPIDNWYIITGVDLNKWSNNNIVAGGLRYNGKKQTFEKYKI